MADTLSKLFQASKGEPITISGKLVHGIYKREVKADSVFKINRISHSNDIVQGLRIKCDKGKLAVNGQILTEIILWTDTSPTEVEIKLLSKSDVTVKFWNVWRCKELVQAWVGNAGFYIEEGESKAILECSHGEGGVNFNDLVVEIAF
jgi:hypothetical protein